MSTPLVPPHIAALVPYVPGKPLEELERELGIRGAIKLASNENPLGPSPKALEAARVALGEMHRYPDAAGHGLRKDLAEHHGVPMDHLVLGAGSNELIDLAARTFADPSGHAVTGDPSFVCYRMCLGAVNVPTTEVPLRDRIHWDVDALLDAVRPETTLLFLANPNNPTSTHVARADLERLLTELPERVVAVIDEAYVQFADAPDFVSALALRPLRERLLVLRTFSKAYGLAAFRVGYAVGTPSMVDYINRVRAPFNVGSASQLAARAALADADHVARYVELNRTERARVTGELVRRGFFVAPSQANFILVDVKQPGRGVYDALLRKGVVVRPMPPPIEDHLRITIGSAAENDRFLETFSAVLPRG